MLERIVTYTTVAGIGLGLILAGYAAGCIVADNRVFVAEQRSLSEARKYRKVIISMEDEIDRLSAQLHKANVQATATPEPLPQVERQTIEEIIAGQISKDLQQRELNLIGRLFGFN